MVVRKQDNTSRKYGIYQKLVFRTKGPYRVLEKATLSSYCLQHFPFCEGLERNGIKLK